MSKRVLVTGANGHLGNTLVKMLCDKGYKVRATVRDPEYVAEEGIFEGYDDIEIYQADIRDADAIRAAMEGIEGVFQVAALYNYDEQSLGEGIVANNTEGTEVVLGIAKAAGVKRVVMTSSIVSIGFGGTDGKPQTEADWSDPADPYCCSKMESEKAAWAFCEKNDLPLVTICPSQILGPNYYKHTPSTSNVSAFINNQIPFRFELQSSVVDVRDVALAHIMAYENEAANGRYLVSGHHVPDFCEALKEVEPEMLVPERMLTHDETVAFVKKAGGPLEMIGHTFLYSDARIKEDLGWEPRPLNETLIDSIDWLKAREM